MYSTNIEDYPEGIVLPIDKPYRWTSADVIRKVKYNACKHFGKKKLKVGHAGTLDPLATGILLVCIGPATRRAEELQRSTKEYIAGITFGATTPSYDLEKEPDQFYPLSGVSKESLDAVIPGFIGEQQQIAPLFSAKSVDGVRAYETARKLLKEAKAKGETFNDDQILSSSTINIYEMELLDYYDSVAVAREDALSKGYVDPETIRGGSQGRINVADASALELPTAYIRVVCSKGTYIRALARDLGEALGSGAFLSSLRRTSNGGYTIKDALTLDSVLAELALPRVK